MTIRFTVLGSGSAGNASLVQVDGFGLLLDAGLGPRQLAARLEAVGSSWNDIHAVLLTHTHTDHWHERTLAHLGRRSIAFYCHVDHGRTLAGESSEFAELMENNLVRTYEGGQVIGLAPGFAAHALPLRHDSGRTFGFRLEFSAEPWRPPVVLGYAADLGSWTPALARRLADADILALEFNHDVEMQMISSRPHSLVRRILSERGHLSNAQAADLVREVLRLSAANRPRHLVLLHLSQECNRPYLALAAARTAVAGREIAIHATCQDEPIPTLSTGPPPANWRMVRPRLRQRAQAAIAWLPGMEP
jgi:ribonuclease BN (tRNA processing enzyme)